MLHSTHAARPRNSYDVIQPGGRTIWCRSGPSSVHQVGHTRGLWPTYTYAGDGRRPGRDPGLAGRPLDGTMCVRLPHTRRRRLKNIHIIIPNSNNNIILSTTTKLLLLLREVFNALVAEKSHVWPLRALVLRK